MRGVFEDARCRAWAGLLAGWEGAGSQDLRRGLRARPGAGEARPCSCLLGGGSPRLLSRSSPWEAIWTRLGGRVEAQRPRGLLLGGAVVSASFLAAG